MFHEGLSVGGLVKCLIFYLLLVGNNHVVKLLVMVCCINFNIKFDTIGIDCCDNFMKKLKGKIWCKMDSVCNLGQLVDFMNICVWMKLSSYLIM